MKTDCEAGAGGLREEGPAEAGAGNFNCADGLGC